MLSYSKKIKVKYIYIYTYTHTQVYRQCPKWMHNIDNVVQSTMHYHLAKVRYILVENKKAEKNCGMVQTESLLQLFSNC